MASSTFPIKQRALEQFVGTLLSLAIHILDKPHLFTSQGGHQIPGCGRAIGTLMPVQADGCSTGRAFPNPYIVEASQSSAPFAEMAYFFPATTLGFNVRFFRQADSVVLAEFIEAAQKRLVSLEAVSPECD